MAPPRSTSTCLTLALAVACMARCSGNAADHHSREGSMYTQRLGPAARMIARHERMVAKASHTNTTNAGESDNYPGFLLKTFSQKVDHFNFENPGVWNQRYMVSTNSFDPSKKTPIMFFTGAEGGDITRLYEYSYGYALEVAKKLGAMIVYMEHRFFGESMPFGDAKMSDIISTKRLGVLSVEQALADYADLISSIVNNHSAWACPTITFGGSLAGTLSSLMRVRYPHIVDIAWASSAPLLGYPHLRSQFLWRKQVTDNFETFSPGCPTLVRKGFASLINTTNTNIVKAINVCKGHNYTWVDIQSIAWGIFEGDGEFCYPPKNSQIKQHCEVLANADKNSKPGQEYTIFTKLIQESGQYWSGKDNCLNISAFYAGQTTPGGIGWSYLADTEIIHPIGANNVTDMFPPFNWSLTDTAYWAKQTFNVTPDANHMPRQFGMEHMSNFKRVNSRIMFVYGLRDPWHTLGVGTVNLTSSLPVITIAEGSHCSDCFLPNSNTDTASMTAARKTMLLQLQTWVSDVVHEKSVTMDY